MLLLFSLIVVCANCHPEIVARYLRTPMANTSGKVAASEEFAGRFYHAASRTTFEIAPVQAGGLELRAGHERVRLDFFIGSRRMGRSYAFLDNGYLYQAPVGYYATRRGWDMAPGYQDDIRPDFDRPITAECLYCHASGVRVEVGTLNRVANWSGLHGVTCERCHGDGEAHAAHPERRNIVNPARLPPPLRQAVCEQCHLSGEARLLLPGKTLEDFRPGEKLSDYLAVYVAAGAPRGVRVNSHAEALARSRCRRESRTLWCGTCHDPHRAAVGFRDKCLGCHAQRQCPSPQRDAGDCTRCHMPKARAYDGGHTTFTDHSIPRRPAEAPAQPGPPAELAAYFTDAGPPGLAARNLGLAYAQAGAKYGRPAWLEKAWPLLRQAAQSKPRDAALYAQMAVLLQADGRIEQAVDFYRLSLQIGPNQDAVLVNLAGLLYRQGKKQEARDLWRRALALNPRQPAAQEALRRK
ncbi:MAG TPA: tetratricopeptide repeat protein [Bryobacterales bacterium]|nr:tetratricopeptide repeat protein [Bryobacterales bacterium]